MKRLLYAGLLALMLVFVVATPVLATVTTPDSLTLEEVDGSAVWAYQNLAETGDMVFIYYYNAYYSGTEPDDIASTTLLLRLMNSSTELGHAVPYPYHLNGYQRGVAGIYFTAAQVTAIGITWGNAYNATLEPNPLITWNPSAPSSYSASIDWDTATTQKGAQTNLGNRIITLALLLKAYWGTNTWIGNLVEAKDGVNYTLTQSSDGAGQEYFTGVLPNLRNLAPQIFNTQITQPIYKTDVPALPYAPDHLPVDVTTTATAFGMTKTVLLGIVSMVGIVAFSMHMVSKAPYLGRYLVLIDGTLIIYFTRIGSVVPVFVSIIGVIALLIIGIVMFYQPSSA